MSLLESGELRYTKLLKAINKVSTLRVSVGSAEHHGRAGPPRGVSATQVRPLQTQPKHWQLRLWLHFSGFPTWNGRKSAANH